MSVDTPPWQEYEREIHEEVSFKYPDSEVLHNQQLPGALSGTQRQIDLLVTEILHGREIRTAIEAKYYSRKIDVKGVEAFIGMLRDVGVDRDVMISLQGYTKAAYERAFRDDVDVDLDVFSLAEFKQWQAAGGNPVWRENGSYSACSNCVGS